MSEFFIVAIVAVSAVVGVSGVLTYLLLGRFGGASLQSSRRNVHDVMRYAHIGYLTQKGARRSGAPPCANSDQLRRDDRQGAVALTRPLPLRH